jgi:tRNA(fMet)-specific endonuclease VapC
LLNRHLRIAVEEIRPRPLFTQRNILARLDALPRNERPLISGVVLSELRYGVRKSRWRKANQALLDEFLLDFDMSDYGASAAVFYGELRTDLEKR